MDILKNFRQTPAKQLSSFDNNTFTPCEQHMLAIIKSLQEELLKVSRERDKYKELLHTCTDQIIGIVTSHPGNSRYN